MSREAWHRRDALVTWLDSHPGTHTAADIWALSDVYAGHRNADRCFDDLKALWNKGLVDRLPGRPARWRF